MPTVAAIGAAAKTSPMAPMSIERRNPGPTDVQIDILFCGVCHSDLHTVRSEWPGTVYPCVPGHEIVGRVASLGAAVTNLKIGDHVGVGCMVDSCRACRACRTDLQQYCAKGPIFTYNAPDIHLPGRVTYGGYSKQIVVDQAYVLRIPKNLDLAGAAPLLCAGITTYSPLRHWDVEKGMKVGVVGLGGLGHMGVKFAHAFGADTFLFTTSPAKAADGKRLGADEVIISKDEASMKKHLDSFDFILNTVSAPHNLDQFTELLKVDGTLCLLGAPETPHPSPGVFNLLFKRRAIAGSLIGGIKETQEMLDFCGQHNIVSDIEMIKADQVDASYERMKKGDVKYRFVIDMATLAAGK
ncbi:NAD(P)-dependent alcohol dehydrogenase [soil metagenome]